MAKQELDPTELSRQLMKPAGEVGRQVALKMNEFNRSLYELAWKILDIKSANHLLEIGFGNGKYIPYYFEQNLDITVTGVDFSEDMCEAARLNNAKAINEDRLIIHCSDSASMPSDDDSFDLVIGLNTIFFWNPPEPHLEEIRRVLKPDGRLLLGYRPRASLENLSFTQQNFTLYEPSELRDLLENNGFKVIKEELNTFETKMDEGDEESIEITDACVIAEKI